MSSIALKEQNGNGHSIADEQDAKRERANLIRRINRRLLKGNRKLCAIRDGDGDRRYYLVDILLIHSIKNLTDIGREIGAIESVGRCVCRRKAWHHVEGVPLCDACAATIEN
jgi:hypothetical protein